MFMQNPDLLGPTIKNKMQKYFYNCFEKNKQKNNE